MTTTPTPMPLSPRRFTMLRTLRLQDYLTLLNAACGVAAVMAAIQVVASGSPAVAGLAVALILTGAVADLLDGRVARRLGTPSLLGRELDSLADVISFGVAPAALWFALGLDTPLDLAALTFLSLCGVARLARFNVTADTLSAGAAKVPYFEGAPITSSVAWAALAAVCVAGGWVGAELPLGVMGEGPLAVHPLSALPVMLGCLQVSRTLRIPKP